MIIEPEDYTLNYKLPLIWPNELLDIKLLIKTFEEYNIALPAKHFY